MAAKKNEPFPIYRLYLSYRIFVAFLLAAVHWSFGDSLFLGSSDPQLFSIVLFAYLLLTFGSLVLSYLPSGPYKLNNLFNMLVDSVAIALLMQASGGITSGLGILLAISIAFNSINSNRHSALLYASIATLAVFVPSFSGYLSGHLIDSALTQAGVLGLAYFAIALLSYLLANQAVESEKLAQQMGIDLANLGEVNEYVIQKMETGIIVVDNQQIIRLMNEAAWSILGMPDATRNQALFLASEPLAAQLSTWRKQDDYQPPLFKAYNGSHMIRSSFTNLGTPGSHSTLIFIEDATYIKEQAQHMKLASLGQLTASIAHEIRNPLGAISHAAQLLNESQELKTPDQRLTDIILNNSERLNRVIENILKLSRRKSASRKPLILEPWLHKLVAELAHCHQLEGRQINLSVVPEKTTVNTDRQQLEQIIGTFFNNAVTHFGRDTAGLNIHISAGINESSSGPFIDFSDNGPSIPENLRDRIFEPFFTTRNDGTGLGLYIASELCEANQITLEYLPILAGGNCFRLIFPYPNKRIKIL